MHTLLQAGDTLTLLHFAASYAKAHSKRDGSRSIDIDYRTLTLDKKSLNSSTSFSAFLVKAMTSESSKELRSVWAYIQILDQSPFPAIETGYVI